MASSRRSIRQPLTDGLLTILTTVGVIALLLHSIGCSTVQPDWERTKQTDTIEAYNAFLLQHPDTSLSGSARSHIESLTMEAARKANDRRAYENYLDAYPHGQFAFEARSRMDDLAFATAKQSHTLQAMEDYLKDFRYGPHVVEANAALESLSYEGAVKNNTVKAFQDYITRFPNGKRIKQARLALTHLPLLTACLDGDAATVNTLLQSGRTLSAYPAAGRRSRNFFSPKSTPRHPRVTIEFPH